MVDVFLHLLLGSVLGIFFGILISRFDAFRIDSMGKGLMVGVMAGLVTIPLGCIPFALVVGVPLRARWSGLGSTSSRTQRTGMRGSSWARNSQAWERKTRP